MAEGLGLNTQKEIFKKQVAKALEDAFLATFIFGAGDEGSDIAKKFANKATGPLVDAIEDFIKSAKISGIHTLTPVEIISPMGPCTGALQLNMPGELKLS